MAPNETNVIEEPKAETPAGFNRDSYWEKKKARRASADEIYQKKIEDKLKLQEVLKEKINIVSIPCESAEPVEELKNYAVLVGAKVIIPTHQLTRSGKFVFRHVQTLENRTITEKESKELDMTLYRPVMVLPTLDVSIFSCRADKISKYTKPGRARKVTHIFANRTRKQAEIDRARIDHSIKVNRTFPEDIILEIDAMEQAHMDEMLRTAAAKVMKEKDGAVGDPSSELTTEPMDIPAPFEDEPAPVNQRDAQLAAQAAEQPSPYKVPEVVAGDGGTPETPQDKQD